MHASEMKPRSNFVDVAVLAVLRIIGLSFLIIASTGLQAFAGNACRDAFAESKFFELDKLTQEVAEQINEARRSTSTTLLAESVFDAPRSQKATARWSKADRKVEEWARQKSELSLPFLLEIHRTLVGKPKAEFRKHNLYLAGKYWGGSHYEEIPTAMIELVRWYSENAQRLAPIPLASGFAQRFLAIHPFADGNGREARLFRDWILMSRGLSPTTISEPLAPEPHLDL